VTQLTTHHPDTAATAAAPLDPRTVLSTLWVFVTLNYLYCDVLSLMNPEDLRALQSGNLGGISITPTFLLAAGALMQIPMAMVLVARFAPRRTGRPANVTAAAVMTLVQLGSLLVGTGPAPHYLFFTAVEVTTTLFIASYALRWRADR
jgi:hypothetical protein